MRSMSAFPRLSEPIGVGPTQARNRIMRLATVTNLAEGGRVSDRLIAHYRAVARGGAAIVVTEALRVHDALAASLREAGIAEIHLVGDAFAPRRLANAVEDGHRAGRAV